MCPTSYFPGCGRHCQDCYFGGLYLVRSEAIVAGVLTIALCLFGVPLVVMFPAVPNGSYLATLLILIRVSQVLALAAILVQVGHLAQLRVDRVIAKATRGSMVRVGQPSPKQERNTRIRVHGKMAKLFSVLWPKLDQKFCRGLTLTIKFGPYGGAEKDLQNQIVLILIRVYKVYALTFYPT